MAETGGVQNETASQKQEAVCAVVGANEVSRGYNTNTPRCAVPVQVQRAASAAGRGDGQCAMGAPPSPPPPRAIGAIMRRDSIQNMYESGG